MAADIIHGDCLDVLRGMDADSVDSVVCDPPYGLRFMGAKWDYDVPSVEIWREVFRVLKPGGHVLSFSGTRTYHRMVVNIEDAGFVPRDMLAWVYGSGFPKSLDVSKAIDKAAGAEREVVGSYAVTRDFRGKDYVGDPSKATEVNITAPATDAAKQWQGFGTALKPALEPIVLARKPLSERTVAAQVMSTGTGALAIDKCRVATEDDLNGGRYSDNKIGDDGTAYGHGINRRSASDYQQPAGRWPANLLHDGSEEVLALFPVTGKSPATYTRTARAEGNWLHAKEVGTEQLGYGDQGSAARFFYCAKASKRDRGEGNSHSTVKPTDLMRWLCRLVTPPGGIVLDPFMGSGSTGKAALAEGFRFVGIERELEYVEIARRRIQPDLLSMAAE